MATSPEKTLLKRQSSLRMVRKGAARVTGMRGFLSGKARNSLLKKDPSVHQVPKVEDFETKEEPAEPVKVVQPVPVEQDVPVAEDRKEPVVEEPVVEEPVVEEPVVAEEPSVNDKPVETPLKTPVVEPAQEEDPQDAPVKEVIKPVAAIPDPVQAIPLETMPHKTMPIKKVVADEEEKEQEHMSRLTSFLLKFWVGDGVSVDPIVIVLCNP